MESLWINQGKGYYFLFKNKNAVRIWIGRFFITKHKINMEHHHHKLAQIF